MIITLGLLSGLLTTCAWLPQLLRTWRRGRADDISYTYLGIFAAGVLGWLAYGLLRGAARGLRRQRRHVHPHRGAHCSQDPPPPPPG